MADGLGNGVGQVGSTGIATSAVGTSEIEDASIIAADLATNAVVTASISGLAVSTAKIAASAVTSAKQGFVGTGSPTGFGLGAQTGSFQASDVEVVVSYGTAFGAAPKYVTVSLLSSGAAATQPGMVTGIAAGSFTALGASGLDYAYLAVGSGDI